MGSAEIFVTAAYAAVFVTLALWVAMMRSKLRRVGSRHWWMP